MDKKVYMKPEFEVIKFSAEEVVVTSCCKAGWKYRDGYEGCNLVPDGSYTGDDPVC